MSKKNKSLENSNEKCIDKKQVGGGRKDNLTLNTQSSESNLNFYRELIVKRIEEIENLKYLEFLYNLMKSFQKKWGI